MTRFPPLSYYTPIIKYSLQILITLQTVFPCSFFPAQNCLSIQMSSCFIQTSWQLSTIHNVALCSPGKPKPHLEHRLMVQHYENDCKHMVNLFWFVFFNVPSIIRIWLKFNEGLSREGRPGSHYCLVIGCQAAHETLIYNSFMSVGCHEIWMQRKCFQPLKKFSTTTMNVFNCGFLLLFIFSVMVRYVVLNALLSWNTLLCCCNFLWIQKKLARQQGFETAVAHIISGWCHLHIQTEI